MPMPYTHIPGTRCLLVALSVLFLSCSGNGQSTSARRAVTPSAVVVQEAQPAITVTWPPSSGTTGYTLYRRTMGTNTWGAALATLPSSATSYLDTSVEPGLAYEYKITRTAGSTVAHGYVSSGIALPPVERRGVMLLVVESGAHQALGAAVDDLEEDLLADGWFAQRIVLDAADTPASVRQQIIAAWDAAPADVKAVYLLGNVPVPYSGNQAPDGHGEHAGAWACDGYYGELNGNWTDASVNSSTGNWSWNHNVPGDGKLDQNSFPSPLELQVGRVDLSRLPAFAETEEQLLADYLAKAHAFKTGALRVPERAVIWDNLQWTNYPLAVSGHMALVPCVGADSVQELSSLLPFHQHFMQQDDLLTFQAGTGILGGPEAPFPGMDNGMSTMLLPDHTRGGVFNMAIGSYFGDWDNTNNYLRALLARGNALVHVWSGLPNWFLHPLAMGENVGYCALRTHNNTANDYILANGGWQGQSMGRVHLGLMGDPSLRLRYLAPPTDLVATNDQWYATFSWQPSPDPVDGYLIYRIDEVQRSIERMTPTPVQGTTYTADTPFEPGVRYMVRALSLRTTPSGSYHDLSLGALAVSEGTQLADCAGVVGGPAIPGTPCEGPNGPAEYDEDCVCGGNAIGIDEQEGSGLRVWPSPVDHSLHVQGAGAGGMLTVRDMAGAEVLRQRMDGSQVALDTSGWSAGTYVVEWTGQVSSGGPLRRRIVVAH